MKFTEEEFDRYYRSFINTPGSCRVSLRHVLREIPEIESPVEVALSHPSERLISEIEEHRDKLMAELNICLRERDEMDEHVRRAEASEEVLRRERDQLRAELEKTRGELEACKQSFEVERQQRLEEAKKLCALEEQHESLRAAAQAVLDTSNQDTPWSPAEARLMALLKPAPAEAEPDRHRVTERLTIVERFIVRVAGDASVSVHTQAKQAADELQELYKL